MSDPILKRCYVVHFILPLILLAAGAAGLAAEPAAGSADNLADVAKNVRGESEPSYSTTSIRGKVVWMAEALERRFGIQAVPEARKRVLALEATDGQLYPILEDLRGRSFRKDDRLRKLDVELLVRSYEQNPMVQVIRIYELRDDGKYELDYWCEICAIAMFELKPCDCCQGDIELRARKVPSND